MRIDSHAPSKRSKCVEAGVVLMLALCAAAGPAAAQEDPEPPWETWQPPAVEMPDPNAWEIYLRAFSLSEASEQRLEDELGEGAQTTID